MAFLSETEVRKIIKEELAASPDLVGISDKSVSSWIEEMSLRPMPMSRLPTLPRQIRVTTSSV